MTTETDNVEQPKNLSDREIFTKIWFSPRKVFKDINERCYSKYVPVLLVLAGISRALERASVKNLGDKLPPSHWGVPGVCILVGICIIGGGLLGWVGFYLYAALISWTGKWLKGKGDTKSIARVWAYAMIPYVVVLVFWAVRIGIYGIEVFKENGDVTSAGLFLNIIFYLSGFLTLVIGIWMYVFCVIGISEVQKFSIWKSILNILMPVFVVFIPIGLILILIGGLLFRNM